LIIGLLKYIKNRIIIKYIIELILFIKEKYKIKLTISIISKTK
jgi:hypothetical protein